MSPVASHDVCATNVKYPGSEKKTRYIGAPPGSLQDISRSIICTPSEVMPTTRGFRSHGHRLLVADNHAFNTAFQGFAENIRDF